MLVKNVPSELYIYFFDTELQRSDDSIVYTGWRQTNTKAQHHTTQKSKKMSNMGLTKIHVLAKRKQFLVGEDSQSYPQSNSMTFAYQHDNFIFQRI
jgi:hypothetical protein